MSGGQPTPPILIEAFALNAPNCTPEAPIAGGKTFPFPTASQINTLNGAASLNDGYPPLTMTDPTDGGVPPFGCDTNGIFYILSAWVAFLGAGQLPVFDATLAADMGGYAIGARLQQAANPTETWTNTVAGNASDPDTGTPGAAGWISSTPLYSAAALAGPNDVVLPGPSDYIISVATGSGAVTFSGFVAQRDGQRLTLIANGANNIKLLALQGSAAGNQIQASGESDITGNDSITIQYSTGFGKWLLV